MLFKYFILYLKKAIQSSLNLAKSDEVAVLVKQIPKERLSTLYLICLAQGLLQSRQSLVCGGLQKFYPWRVSTIVECLNSLIRNLSAPKSSVKTTLDVWVRIKISRIINLCNYL